MLACPGFPADKEEEEVVHLLLYIPYYSGSVVCIRFKVYRYRTAGAVVKLRCTPLYSNLQSTS